MPVPVHLDQTRQLLGQSPEGSTAAPVGQLTPRQQQLDQLWQYFRCTTYEGWAVDWNGHYAPGLTEHDNIARSGMVPAGFTDPSGSAEEVPLQFRKPSAPYFLGRVIVKRFTGLLFGAKRHPKIVCDDPLTEDWLQGFASVTRLWAQLLQGRNYGGAMGSVGLGFKFAHGKPQVEVHDPRWCFPEFMDREGLVLRKFEIRYQYNEPVRDRETGELVDRFFWYRRIIDTEADTVWPKVLVDDEGSEPRWETERSLQEVHGYGFVPIVWIQNQPVQDDVDGDPDCHGCFDMIRRIDGLYSQANKGTIANCDPTTHVASDAEGFADGVRKGSSNAIWTEKGGEVNYLELAGGGIDKALDLAERFEQKALTVAQCVLDDSDVKDPQKTATEVTRKYSSMTEQADVLREQYGEHGVLRLLEMVLRAARMLAEPRRENRADGTIGLVRSIVRLPKKQVKDPVTGKTTWVARQLGDGEQVELRWPDYFARSESSVSSKVDAAGKALTFHLVDQKHATEYIAEDFQVENVPEVLAKVKQERLEEQQLMTGTFPEDDSLANKVTERVQAGDNSPLPDPTARELYPERQKARIRG